MVKGSRWGSVHVYENGEFQLDKNGARSMNGAGKEDGSTIEAGE